MTRKEKAKLVPSKIMKNLNTSKLILLISHIIPEINRINEVPRFLF